MFYLTWLTGIAVFLDIWLLIIMSIYQVRHWSEKFTLTYCLAFALWLYLLGHALERSWAFYLFLKVNPDIPWAQIDDLFPIAGSFWYVVGTGLVSVGLLKLQKVFSEAYIGGLLAWIFPLLVSSILPLIFMKLI